MPPVSFHEYVSKWKGEETAGPAPIPSKRYLFYSTIGGFAAMGAITAMSVLTQGMDDGFLAMVGSYGALMVLVFGAPASPLAQPRNILGGNLIATLVGVGCRVWIADPMGTTGFALPFAVTLSYFIMQMFDMVNPPGGGAAAICVVSSPQITDAGWKLVVTTTLYSVVFILTACVFINMIPGRHYPKYWFVSTKYYYPALFGASTTTIPAGSTPEVTIVAAGKESITRGSQPEEQQQQRQHEEDDDDDDARSIREDDEYMEAVRVV